MKLLAFDTSTRWLTVACVNGSQWIERAELAGQAHSQRLLPLVDEVLSEAQLALADLDGLAFGAGPGSFTGVRIACGVAQGLALGADLRVVPVSTLEALAESAWRTHGWARVVACLDARMREVYIGDYRREGDAWIVEREPAVLRPGDVAPVMQASMGAGDGFAAYPDLAARLALGRTDADALPTARAIATLAAPRFKAGEAVSAAEALPFYVRHRVALTTAERDAGVRL
jgi:tRNA threonylcarbamoyladenosine biosynthesis protein TsaB